MKLALAAVALLLAVPAASSGQLLKKLGQPAQPPADGPVQQSQPQQAAYQEWVKPGMKATWLSTSATIPGALQTLEPDKNGKWINKQTGQRYGMQDRPGASSSGLEEMLVMTVSPERVVLSQRSLQHVPISGAGVVTSAPGKAVVVTPTTMCEHWVPPAVLAATKDGETGVGSVSRFPFEHNGQVFNAIRISEYGASSKSWRTYDLDTGLMLQFSMATQMGGRAGAPGSDGRPTSVGGDTLLINVQLAGLRQTGTPGPGVLAAPHLMQLSRMNVSASDTLTMGEFGSNSPTHVQFTADLRVENDLLTITANGNQTRASVGGTYLPPQTLAGFHRGQVLDEDPITGMTVRVADVGNGVVIIEELNPLEHTRTAYDAQSGLCVQQVRTSNSGGSATTTKDIRLQFQ